MNGIITLLYLFLQYSDAFAIKILTFMKQTYYNSFSNVEKNHVGGSPKSNLLFTILNQNNINVNVLFALLGLILGKISYNNNIFWLQEFQTYVIEERVRYVFYPPLLSDQI